MSKSDEIERLDQMGRDAASAARHGNHWRNHAGGRNAMASHAALGTGAMNAPLVGRLAIPVALFIIFGIVLSWGFGVAQPGGPALAIVLVIETAWFVLKRRRLSRLQQTSQDLNSQLHDLKEQDFALRYEEAKRSGQLDRFKKSNGAS